MKIPMFIKRIAKVCDSSNGRYSLSGIKCESDGTTAKLTATDGRVLACVHWHDSDAIEMDVIADAKQLSKHSAQAFRHSLGVRFDGESLRGGASGAVEHVGDRFPDYERILPDTLDGYVGVRLDATLLRKLCDLSIDMNDDDVRKGITLFVKDHTSCVFGTTVSDEGHVARFAIMPRASDDMERKPEWPERPGVSAAESVEEDDQPSPPPECMDDDHVAAAVADDWATDLAPI